LQSRVGNDAIAEYPATGSSYARACEVISRESCRCNARPRRHKGTPGETISNSAAADARASDRMAGKSQTPAAASKARSATSNVPAEAPAAASKARSTASDVPTEAAASAAATAWTRGGRWRAVSRARCGMSALKSRCHRGQHHPCRAGCDSRNPHRSDHYHRAWRSRADRARQQPRPSRRERHRPVSDGSRGCGQASWFVEGSYPWNLACARAVLPRRPDRAAAAITAC
jgi:hypothetical protein